MRDTFTTTEADAGRFERAHADQYDNERPDWADLAAAVTVAPRSLREVVLHRLSRLGGTPWGFQVNHGAPGIVEIPLGDGLQWDVEKVTSGLADLGYDALVRGATLYVRAAQPAAVAS